MLNTAKRSRTTVEALELKGYRYANENKIVRKKKMNSLKLRKNDFIFIAISALWMILCFIIVAFYLGGNI